MKSLSSFLSSLVSLISLLKPISINVVKTPLLAAGTLTLLWLLVAKTAEERLRSLTGRLARVPAFTFTMWMSAALTALVSYLAIRQFYTFTAEAYDLGIYANALWHTVHGPWFFDSLKNEHLLGDHFGLVLFVFAQLYRLWESPVWLLLIQAMAFGLGGLAVGLLGQRLTGSTPSTLVLLLFYVSNPYLHSIAALDFHPIALAIPLFLWLLYALETRRDGVLLALAGVTLFVEESLPPGLVGVGLYLFFFRPYYRWTGISLAAIGTAWFLLEVAVFLPYFSQHALIHWDRYDNLGPDFRSALLNLVTDPTLLIREAFLKDGKLYYLAALLFSVGFLPILAWREATLIALPALMMMLSDTSGHYKFGFHYSGVVLPFLFFSAAHGMAKLNGIVPLNGMDRRAVYRILAVSILVVLLANVYSIRWSRLAHLDEPHVGVLHEVVGYIPAAASVRAEGNLVAMLSSRDRIAPLVDEPLANFEWWRPDYVVFDQKHVGQNSVQRGAREVLMQHLREDEQYRLVFERDGVLLFASTDAPTAPGVAD